MTRPMNIIKFTIVILHCRDFTLNCSYVQTQLVNQIAKWNNTDCPPPGQGEKCRYAVSETTVLNFV